MKVVVLDYAPYRPFDAEAKATADSEGNFSLVSYEEFCRDPWPADVILNAGGWPISAPLLYKLRGVRCIVGYGVGTDFVDLECASRMGTLIVRMPLANTVDVALHTLALILACARKLSRLDAHVRAGGFDGSQFGPFYRLSERKLCLLAFGNIPRILTGMASSIFHSISAFDPYVSPQIAQAHGVELLPFPEILETAEVLSVHLPAGAETTGLVSARHLSLLPSGAIVVITSRGSVYDAEALAGALQAGQIAAAGLDVFPEEPIPPTHPLLRAPNVLLTPHVAGLSQESLRDAHEAAAIAIAAVALGEIPDGAVNTHAWVR